MVELCQMSAKITPLKKMSGTALHGIIWLLRLLQTFPEGSIKNVPGVEPQTASNDPASLIS